MRTSEEIYEELMTSMIAYAGEEYDEADDVARLENIMRQCLGDAVQEIAHILYPNGVLDDDKRTWLEEYILNIYKHKVRYIAEYHFDKQGKEGVILYSENDTSSHFESSGTPASYLKGIIPIAIIN